MKFALLGLGLTSTSALRMQQRATTVRIGREVVRRCSSLSMCDAVDEASIPVLSGWSQLQDGRFTGVLSTVSPEDGRQVWLRASSISLTPGPEPRMAFIKSPGGRLYQLGEQDGADAHLLRSRHSWAAFRHTKHALLTFALLSWSALTRAAMDEDLLPKLGVACGASTVLMLTYLAVTTSGTEYMYSQLESTLS